MYTLKRILQENDQQKLEPTISYSNKPPLLFHISFRQGIVEDILMMPMKITAEQKHIFSTPGIEDICVCVCVYLLKLKSRLSS